MRIKTVCLTVLVLTAKAAINFPQKGNKCKDNSDCFEPWENCQENVCFHKDAWPLYTQEWFMIFICPIWLCGCLTAGVSGGGTLVPWIRLMWNFSASDAIALSNASIVCGALCSFVVNFKKRHPLKKDLDGKPAGLILDYNIAAVALPMGVVGSAIGAIIPQVVPEPVIIGILTVLLIIVIISTANKFKKMVKAENEKFAAQKKAKEELELAAT